MLRLPTFEYHAPATIGEAVDLLREFQPDAAVVSGGTDLFPNMKRKVMAPKHLIGLGQLDDMDYVRVDADRTLRIGAATPLATLASHEAVAVHAALASAARSGSTPHLQNMGTIGGNLCLDTRCTYYNQSAFWRDALGFCMKYGGTICRVAPNSDHCLATHSADTAPALMVLGAEVSIVSAGGSRVVPVADLYRNDGMQFLQLQRDEILTEVRVPPNDGYQSSYWKLRERDAIDFPLAGVAVAIKLDEDGTVADARVAVTAIFSAPTRLQSVEKLLIGSRLTEAVIRAAGEAGYKAAHPVDNTSGTIVQRRTAVGVFIRRALEAAANH